MYYKLGRLVILAVLAWMLMTVLQANPTFIPDVTFKGSTLTGWRTLGQASWQAQNGEIIGTAKQGGGWLMLDRSYQDVAFHALFRCTGDCNTGVLLRAEKAADGMKGLYVSLAGGVLAVSRVKLDEQGRETQRDALRRAGGWVRVMAADSGAGGRGGTAPATGGAGAPAGGRAGAPAPGGAGAQAGGAGAPAGARGGAQAAGGRAGAPGGGFGRGPAGPVPITPPNTAFRPGDWNEIEIIVDAGILRSYLNNGRETAGVAEDDAGSYGPVALYVGGEGEVRFKDVGYKDLAIRVTPKEQVSPRFQVQKISDMYYAWTAATADFNRDGALDIVAGPYIYYGPDFTKSRELYTATSLKPSTEWPYAHCNFAYDFNGDGWPDVLAGPPGAALFINPKGESRRWARYSVLPNYMAETTLLRDIDGDGRPEFIYQDSAVRYAKYDPADPTKPWTAHAVSERGYGQAHGLGVGDINGDGRLDIVNVYGWWEQPPAGSDQETWTYHPQAFGWYSRGSLGGVGMFVYDINGDKLNDVVTVLSSHGFGLAWYEQKRDAAGKISFVEHIISEGYGGQNAGGVAFSEAHGTAMGDVDGDGIPDFIVGKRYWTHLDSFLDPDPYGAPVLYWYRTVRNKKAPGGAEFVPELIHNRSGAGSDILAVDLNKDGVLDIVTSTNRGTFIFWGKPRAAAKKAAIAAPGN